MKNMKKKIAALALSGVMVVIAGYGTLAYFTDQDSATNEFTVGNIAIDLTETHWSEADDKGQATNYDIKEWNTAAKEENSQYTGNWGIEQAKKIMPSRIIPKNPAITIKADSEDCYVRMLVTMPKDLYEQSNFNYDTEAPVKYIFNWVNGGADWKDVGAPSENQDGSVTLTFSYKEKVKTDGSNQTLELLFDAIGIGATITGDEMPQLNEFNIKVDAQAIQAEGFINETEAFAAFSGQN